MSISNPYLQIRCRNCLKLIPFATKGRHEFSCYRKFDGNRKRSSLITKIDEMKLQQKLSLSIRVNYKFGSYSNNKSGGEYRKKKIGKNIPPLTKVNALKNRISNKSSSYEKIEIITQKPTNYNNNIMKKIGKEGNKGDRCEFDHPKVRSIKNNSSISYKSLPCLHKRKNTTIIDSRLTDFNYEKYFQNFRNNKLKKIIKVRRAQTQKMKGYLNYKKLKAQREFRRRKELEVKEKKKKTLKESIRKRQVEEEKKQRRREIKKLIEENKKQKNGDLLREEREQLYFKIKRSYSTSGIIKEYKYEIEDYVFHKFTNEDIDLILSYSESEHIIKMGLVCKQWYIRSCSNDVWKKLIKNTYQSTYLDYKRLDDHCLKDPLLFWKKKYFQIEKMNKNSFNSYAKIYFPSVTLPSIGQESKKRTIHHLEHGLAEKIQKAFLFLDLDKDGFLSVNDLKVQLRKRRIYLPANEYKKLIDVIDIDGDMFVNYPEFKILYVKLKMTSFTPSSNEKEYRKWNEILDVLIGN